MNTINGRTPEEIKQGLERCNAFNACPSCPYEHIVDTEHGWGCVVIRNADTLALIQQLENHIGELTEMVRQLERERDAAVEQLKEVDRVDLFRCSHCIHDELCNDGLTSCIDCDKDCPCHTCEKGSNWQWRGVQEVE